MDRTALAAAALAGFVALGGAAAQDKKDLEKCWGLAKAGQNDCKTYQRSLDCAGKPGTGHHCAGQSKLDHDPASFKLVKTGTCIEMGGSLREGEPGRLAREKKR